MKSVLVTSNKQGTFRAIQSCFPADYTIDMALTVDQATGVLQKKRYDLIFIDIEILNQNVSGFDYKAGLRPFWELCPSIEIIVMSSPEQIRETVKAVKAGARDYLTYPISPEEVKYVSDNINDSVIIESELDYLRDKFWQVDSSKIIQTKSAAMKKVFSKIRSVSPTRSTVLLIGESGTGKSLMAKLIHQHSNRRNSQFISVHCGAIPDTLLESELFGHEKGSFTGAIRRKLGKFEIAQGGTIFLDEIGTITPTAQIKFLQILQDGTFQRIGGEETLKANVRGIAATNADLKKMCDDGKFRLDLYYRLNVFPIELPSLRERIADLSILVDIILAKLNKFYTKEIHSVHPRVMDAFKKYPWPGNIRELENLVERAYILETSSVLTPESLPNELFDSESSKVQIPSNDFLTLAETRQRGIEEIERNYLKDVLTRNKGRINESARNAGITTRQLNKLMNKYGIRKEEFKS
ncbi:MAG: sigma-54-dependent Fis family transcriptional regulator, partial [Desulfobacterales bacterium]|nr:sigma-54-dependent Fis family transcriptional regulator [Desulfobacterales bacterium]